MTNANSLTTATATDLSVRFKIVDRILNDPAAYYNYQWKSGSRPDILAKEYYGDEDLSWLVMLSASVFDWIYDLPMEDDVFNVYLTHKYQVTDFNILASTIHHLQLSDGTIVGSADYALSDDDGKITVSIYDYERDANEARRSIKLISKTYMNVITNELKDKMQSIKTFRRLAE